MVLDIYHKLPSTPVSTVWYYIYINITKNNNNIIIIIIITIVVVIIYTRRHGLR